MPRLPAGQHQEGPSQIGDPRAAVVPARRHQHGLPARRTGSVSGTTGRTQTATWGRSTGPSGGLGQPVTARTIDQIAGSRPGAQAQCRQPALDRHGLGIRPISRAWRLAPCHCPVPVLTWPTAASRASSISAPPTSFGRALQHCKLCAFDHDDGASDGLTRWATSCTASAMRISTSTTSSRQTCSSPRKPRLLPKMHLNPDIGSIFDSATRTSN